MSTTMAILKRAVVAAGAGAALMLLASAADAACRHTIDEDGDPVTLCRGATTAGTHAQARVRPTQTDDADDDDDDDDDQAPGEFVYDEDQGSLVVDLSDCAPGKYWIMDAEAADIPMPCH